MTQYQKMEGERREIEKLRAEVQMLQQQLISNQRVQFVALQLCRAAHDIGNMMTVMLANLSLLREDFQQASGEVDAAYRAANEAQALLRQILHQQPDASDDAEPPQSIEQTIEGAVGLTRPLWIRFHNVHVQTSIQNMPLVTVPTRTLRHIIVNMLLNALSALPDYGGTIVIRTAVDAASVRIILSDDGSGIDPTIVHTLFTPFARPGRSGLGLTTAREELTHYGGKLSVSTIPSGGTTIMLRLPLLAP